jgi:hypothetical protein
MTQLTINPEISFGDLLAIISLGVSAIALLLSWQKDRNLRRKEYADRIRHSAGAVTAKLQRWKDLSLRYYEDIQPLITEADRMLVKQRAVLDIRDLFWQGMVNARTVASQRIMDEQIEIAYTDMYGFDPRIQALFSEVVNRLRIIDKSIYTQALYSTQANIVHFRSAPGPHVSAQLGNELRDSCYNLAEKCKALMNDAIDPFTIEMIKLIQESDQRIVERQIQIAAIPALYPVSLEGLKAQLDQETIEYLAPTARASVSQSPQIEELEKAKFQQYCTYVLVVEDSEHSAQLQNWISQSKVQPQQGT